MNTDTFPIFPIAHESALAQVARPLLHLIQRISGMETSFVTAIDWASQQQDVLFSLNTGEMQLIEGSRVNWSDSMCRSMFLSGRLHSTAIGDEVPATPGAIALAMNSFFAVPILVGDRPIGTVCGASRRQIALSNDQAGNLQLIADAMQQLLASEIARVDAEVRAEHAERDVRDARDQAQRHAGDAKRMQHMAHTDVLTDLPNRRGFMARWEDELARSGRRQYPIALLLFDADGFKNVNDTMGHLMGDSVLRAIGEALKSVAPNPHLTARLGGDEFAMAISHADRPSLLKAARDIQDIFAQAAARLAVGTTLSIGVASSDDCPRHQLFVAADRALYRSKAAGGDRAELFTGALMSQ